MEAAAEAYLEGEVLLIDKSLNWTSFDVVNKIRYSLKKCLGIKKIKVGHAGTLDPLATGLLILCTGKKTKQIDEIQGLTKTYSGVFTIGATTPSYDLETAISEERSVENISEADIEVARQKYLGLVEQVPPVFSALRLQGKRAYQFAREGLSPKMDARQVEIHSFNLKRINDKELAFEIVCSKGTYIRSVARDIGEELGCGAYISSLRREKIGEYDVKNALTISDMVEKICNNLPTTDL